LIVIVEHELRIDANTVNKESTGKLTRFFICHPVKSLTYDTGDTFESERVPHPTAGSVQKITGG
jgi:hypothetical protein